MTAGTGVPLETRISGALNIILGIYGVPVDVREAKVKRVFAMDYRDIGRKAIADFRKFVEKTNIEALRTIIKTDIYGYKI